jgi:hypothetical protein
VELSANKNGLMQIKLPAAASGLLEVRFHMTPWRRRGWYITALSALALAVGVVVAQRFARKRRLIEGVAG